MRDRLPRVLVLSKHDMRAEKRMLQGAGDKFWQGRGDHGWSIRVREVRRTGRLSLEFSMVSARNTASSTKFTY
ncbi:hypothetical protein [Caballeronia ptereochthonis]|uniref:hypothetical protein n=1 Tax=Caballeronia ptereochthonis TaxID=1777144 RepID=UPI001FC98F8E|nr:hypothetical protein [Caballeronia ptereochthonis]